LIEGLPRTFKYTNVTYRKIRKTIRSSISLNNV
jgi:hypothetical protein